MSKDLGNAKNGLGGLLEFLSGGASRSDHKPSDLSGIDALTLQDLKDLNVNPNRLKERSTQGAPANLAGLPSLRMYESPDLKYSLVRGFVVSDPKFKADNENRGRSQTIILAPNEGAETASHEAEHLLARQQLGHPQEINEKFRKLIGPRNGEKYLSFVHNALTVAPYLKEKYGLENAYFSPNFVQKQSSPSRLLYEQLASLASIEYSQNVDLTKDPVLRQTLFKDRDVRETYNAITGLRQTRLDPRDLPPYTRQPEEPGLFDRIKKFFGKANGGSIESTIDSAGGKKLI